MVMCPRELEGIPYKRLRNAYEEEERHFPGENYEQRLYPRDLVIKQALQKYKTQLNMAHQSKKFPQKKREEDDFLDGSF